MVCVMSILLAHELGHYIVTIYYRVTASLPIFLPFPLNPIGTFGAVIFMQGGMADRKQIFDIGIAGPLAGLVIAVPVMFVGAMRMDFSIPPAGNLAVDVPLIMQWLFVWLNEGYELGQPIAINQLEPYFAAAWVGMLITGLNLFPVGQLDGGHLTYTLFGRTAHWIARLTIVVAIAFMVYFSTLMLILMLVLLLLVGTDHPPTRDDSVPLGFFRYALGIVTLTIPIFCFPPFVFYID